jgi:glycosyltransferase A (GT-A) superfamily protein (DUF2064 family)
MDLLIVAKSPVPGRVKTRLCPPCTPEEAAALAEAALAATMAAAVGAGADRVVVALDGAPGPWLPPGVVVVSQGDGDFDRRLATAWTAARGPAVQIGMDTPQVTATELTAALGRLEHEDALLGLACDGGWWAAGLRSPRPDAFLGVPTSLCDTGARQRSRLESLGLVIGDLDVRRDVDTWDDAIAVAAELPETRFAAAVAAVGVLAR